MKKSYNDDAFGQALLDCYEEKGSGVHFVERDDNILDEQDTSVYFVEDVTFGFKYGMHPIEEYLIDNHISGSVLDIGCGAGRHSLYLQNEGFEIVGIDSSLLAVEVCRRQGLQKCFPFGIENITKLAPNKYDTVLMLGHNFGLFGSPKKMPLLLKKIERVTNKNAKILATLADPYQTDNPLHLEYHSFNLARGRMSGQLRIRVRYERLISAWFDYLFVSPKEAETLVSNTNWHIDDISYDNEHKSYAIVLVKKS